MYHTRSRGATNRGGSKGIKEIRHDDRPCFVRASICFNSLIEISRMDESRRGICGVWRLFIAQLYCVFLNQVSSPVTDLGSPGELCDLTRQCSEENVKS